VRDPYDILGVARSASFEEVKAAYRRASKSRHPDMGGSHEAMVELNTAYAFILNELKSGYQKQREEAPKQDRADARGQRSWEQAYRDIDEELEEMRRAAEAHEESLRAMRANAWKAGDRAAWARLTWEDFARFFRGVARSGLKGLALLFAAIVGVGSVLVEANFVSALILLGSGLGFLFSLALKSDKGGMMSAALLLFGIMTLWLPPVRSALFLYPVATISVLILLALIFKFAQAGGTVGLMTGGVLALYVIGVIVDSSAPHPQQVAARPTSAMTPAPGAPPTPDLPRPITPAPPVQKQPDLGPSSPPPQITAPQSPPAAAEPRTLLASQGALLKFVAGISYRLKVRTGFTTSIRATQGKVAFDSGSGDAGQCVESFDLPVRSGAGPWQEIDRTLRACGADALMTVVAVR
jgi:DnaJ-like protein